jgi:hypothetical protein
MSNRYYFLNGRGEQESVRAESLQHAEAIAHEATQHGVASNVVEKPALLYILPKAAAAVATVGGMAAVASRILLGS